MTALRLRHVMAFVVVWACATGVLIVAGLHETLR
jgi:hypothetical protein